MHDNLWAAMPARRAADSPVSHSTSFQLEPEDATRATPKSDHHERRRTDCDESTGSGAMELGILRFRKYDLLNEHRYPLFRRVARIRFERIEYHGGTWQWNFIALDSSIDPSVRCNFGRYAAT
jgi:hypothetical protein